MSDREARRAATRISITVNGSLRSAEVEARTQLTDFIPYHLELNGKNVGCEHCVCGVRTIEGLAPSGGLHPIQRAFQEMHGLQCGFCTPGFLLTTLALLEQDPDPDEDQIREFLSGNLCRCTGYAGIVRSVRRAAELVREEREAQSPGGGEA